MLEPTQVTRLRRIVSAVILCLVAGVCVLSLAVRIHELVVRSRSEALYAAFLQLEPGQTRKSEIEILRSHWAGSLVQSIRCDRDGCDYRIGDLWNESRWLLITRLVHDHQPTSELVLKTKGDVLSSASFSVGTYVPKGYGTREERKWLNVPDYVPYSSGGYMLFGRAALVTELPDTRAVSSQPDYKVWGPSGCMQCLAIWVSALPSLSPAKRENLFQVNFDCMTRWSVCTDKEDLMPTAGKEPLSKHPED